MNTPRRPDITSQTQHTLFHPDEVDLSETVGDLLRAVDRVRPKRIVLDSLSELRLLAGDALRYRREILALKDYFAGCDCTVFLLDDRTTDVGDLQLQSLCHGVLMLEETSRDYGSDRRRLRVTKMRGLRFRDGYHDFVVETGGLRVFPRLVAAEHRAAVVPGQAPSGFPALDALLGGGIDRGTTTLLIGPSGTGQIHHRHPIRRRRRAAGRARRLFPLRRAPADPFRAGGRPGAGPARARWTGGASRSSRLTPPR